MKLRHTSICPVFDIVKEKNPLVISGFVDGMTLENYIEKKEIVLIHALVIVRCILEALSLLHSMNLYYGDVTPRSIVIDEFGGALLYDFSKSNFNGSVFNESAIRTCKFRSPEKASGAAIDYKSDILSLIHIFVICHYWRRLQNIMTTISKREVHRFLDEHPDIPFLAAEFEQ